MQSLTSRDIHVCKAQARYANRLVKLVSWNVDITLPGSYSKQIEIP